MGRNELSAGELPGSLVIPVSELMKDITFEGIELTAMEFGCMEFVKNILWKGVKLEVTGKNNK